MNVPDIDRETGISQDYWNEYFGKYSLLRMEGPEFLAEYSRTRPVRGYTERFPPEEYDDAVTERNAMHVRKLNSLAALANRVLSTPETAGSFRGIAKAAHFLIYNRTLGDNV